jgi:hypothetical protein
MSTSLTMVTRAIAIAVRVSLDLATDVQDEAGYAETVRRRIQGTYGFELRRLADAHPEMGSDELYAAVIAPKEFPWLVVENPHAIDLEAAGERDRARTARPNADPPAPVDDATADAWEDHVATARAGLGTGENRADPEPQQHDPDPDRAAHVDELRARLDAGRARGAEDRKARRDQAS